MQKNANQIDLFKNAVIKDINMIRQQNNLAPVTENDYLDQVEQAHMQQDAKYFILDHSYLSSDGKPEDNGAIPFTSQYIYNDGKGADWSDNTEGIAETLPDYWDYNALADKFVSQLCSDIDHYQGMLNDTANQYAGVGLVKGNLNWYIGWGSLIKGTSDDNINTFMNSDKTVTTLPGGATMTTW